MKGKIISQKTENFFPAGMTFGGILMILMGAGILMVKSVIGAMVLLAGLIIIFLHYGLLIDFEQKRYKKYWGLLGLKFGRWEDLPPIEYISLTKSRFSQEMGLRGASMTARGVLYRGNLRINDHERILVIRSTKKDKVLRQLKEMAKKWNLKLLDCTKSENTWVKL